MGVEALAFRGRGLQDPAQAQDVVGVGLKVAPSEEVVSVDLKVANVVIGDGEPFRRKPLGSAELLIVRARS